MQKSWKIVICGSINNVQLTIMDDIPSEYLNLFIFFKLLWKSDAPNLVFG